MHLDAVSRGGLALARHIAPAYSDNPKVRAVLVGGSVSRGWADEYSDLEIGVLWSEPPTDEERRGAIARTGGELWSLPPADDRDGWAAGDHYGIARATMGGHEYTGTSMVSAHHLAVSTVETWLSDALERYDTGLEKQELLSAIQHGVPLHGEDLLGFWKLRTESYPDELARRIIRENIYFGPWFPADAYASRGDALVLHQHFIWAEQSILRVLAALNRIYYRSVEHKWMGYLIAEMSIAPRDLAARMERVLRADLATGERELRDLMRETIDLVAARMPEADHSFPGDRHPEVGLAWARRRWEPDTPYSLMRSIGAGEDAP